MRYVDFDDSLFAPSDSYGYAPYALETGSKSYGYAPYALETGSKGIRSIIYT